MSARCPKRCPNEPLPAGLTLEAARVHPRFKYLLEPGAQCDLDAGHGDGAGEQDEARRHRTGSLVWWDPPVVFVGGAA